MEHGALEDALEAQGRLGVAVLVIRQQGRAFLDEVGQLAAQQVEIGTAGAQDLGRGGVVHQGEQQVLDRHELVTLLARLLEGHVEGDFEFFA